MRSLVATFTSALLVQVATARAINSVEQDIFQVSAGNDGSNIYHDARQFDFAEWCKESKANFLHALRTGGADEWVIVMGNEAAGKLAYDFAYS